MSKMGLLEVDDARETVKQYLDSRRWWTIVAYSQRSANVMSEIEDAFYTGKANADFHLLIIPYPGLILGLGMAHKRRMSRQALKKLMLKLGAGWELADSNPEQDVIFPTCPSDQWMTEQVMTWLDAWLKGDV